MKDELFAQLLESVHQGGAITRGEMAPSRRFEVVPVENEILNVGEIRRSVGLEPNEFAASLGVSVATLGVWERGKRRPTGPALVLLRVVAKNPRAVLGRLKDNRKSHRLTKSA